MKHRLYCGTINRYQPEDGWTNHHLDVSARTIWDAELDMGVLPDFVMDIALMPEFRDDMWDEIVAHHVLEHLTGDLGRVALGELNRILMPGGILDCEVPDLDRVCRAYCEGGIDANAARQWLLGEQLPQHTPGDSHRFLWTEDELADALVASGFRVPERVKTGLALRFRAVKLA